MTDESIMPFGRHKGKQLADVPARDLFYYYDQGWLYGELKQYVEDNLDVIKSQISLEQKKRGGVPLK